MEHLRSIRETIKQRDDCDDSDVDDMLAEVKELILDGEDPEEALAQVFGLEPDYVYDPELGLL